MTPTKEAEGADPLESAEFTNMLMDHVSKECLPTLQRRLTDFIRAHFVPREDNMLRQAYIAGYREAEKEIAVLGKPACVFLDDLKLEDHKALMTFIRQRFVPREELEKEKANSTAAINFLQTEVGNDPNTLTITLSREDFFWGIGGFPSLLGPSSVKISEQAKIKWPAAAEGEK